MALRFQSEVRIAAGPKRVFAALTGLEEAKHWVQGLAALEQLTDGPLQVGTQWRRTRWAFGGTAVEQFEVTALEPPCRLGLRVDGRKGSSGRGEYLFDYGLEPDEGGTVVQLTGEIRMSGVAARLLGWLFLDSFQKAMTRDLMVLKSYVERGG